MGQFVILPDPESPTHVCNIMAVMGDEVVPLLKVTAFRDPPAGMVVSARTAGRLLAASLSRAEELPASFTERHAPAPQPAPPVPQTPAMPPPRILSPGDTGEALARMEAVMGGDTIRT